MGTKGNLLGALSGAQKALLGNQGALLKLNKLYQESPIKNSRSYGYSGNPIGTQEVLLGTQVAPLGTQGSLLRTQGTLLDIQGALLGT